MCSNTGTTGLYTLVFGQSTLWYHQLAEGKMDDGLNAKKKAE
jgi:hypothetical protein